MEGCFKYVTPRFHQELLLPEKGEERGSEREHERQKGHIIVLLLFYIFSRSAQHREPWDKLKLF